MVVEQFIYASIPSLKLMLAKPPGKKTFHKTKEVPDAKVNWYCTLVCREIHYQLKLLMKCGPEKVPDYLLDLLRKKLKEGDADDVKDRDQLTYFMNNSTPLLIKKQERASLQKWHTGTILGSFELSGVCTAMLTVKSKVVTAGMFRVFGEATVELSIVATSEPYKQKGYFSVLFKCIEKLLSCASKRLLSQPLSMLKACGKKNLVLKTWPQNNWKNTGKHNHQ
nr:hypothetical protein [Tanacetum cinerariifolium]